MAAHRSGPILSRRAMPPCLPHSLNAASAALESLFSIGEVYLFCALGGNGFSYPVKSN